jgi:hypothetical protein
LVGWLVGWSVISFCYGTSKIKNMGITGIIKRL